MTTSPLGKIQWYEYLVRDKDDFDAQITFYLFCQNDKKTIHERLKIMNTALSILKAKELYLTHSSSKNEWASAYWLLYIRGFVKLGYNRTAPTGIMIFAANASDIIIH